MKLIIAIVNSDEAGWLIESLNGGGFSVTKLATTGGFLRAGNATLMIGVDDNQVDDVMEIIREKCCTRKQMTATMTGMSQTGGVMPYPVEVTVGGATVFVLDVDRFEKF